MFTDVVTTEAALREIVGEPSELARVKEIPALDARCRAFIARSPFLLLATSNGHGQCDVSPKGDVPGFVLVLDDTHLAVPDRPGNRRLDGMRNILANPHVGLIFLIPGVGETLRVNGRAVITREPALLARMAVEGRAPRLAIGVKVEECFMHCAKALRRSHLWEPAKWPDLAGVPSGAELLEEQAKALGLTRADLERRLGESYARPLY
jgi:hypothetical protein